VPDPVSDYDLLDAWGKGDLSAGRQLFERHFATLHRFFRTKIDEGLEDLMQQTWLACVEARERFRREASFRTFLLQIARFQLYGHYRDRTRRTAIDFGLTSVADLDPSPSQLVSRRQDERLLLEGLRRVPLDFQIVLELRFWQELSGKEMAEVLGISEPSVRGRLQRATQRLKQELAALMAGRDGLEETLDDLDAWAKRLEVALFAGDPVTD
jgi:RNA polymerase sigma factor (sigma-70 family)